ncbi:MAG: PilZ domain-containing protein [Desulfobulbus sp.]
MDQSNPIKFPAALLQRIQQMMRQMHSIFGPTFSALSFLVLSRNVSDNLPSEASDKRQSPRVTLRNTTVHVTDGCLYATAILENISLSGLCLCNLPEQLYKNAGKLTVFSSDNPGLPVLQIEPRWQNNGWRGKTIGAAILNTTDAWRLFFVHTAGPFTL